MEREPAQPQIDYRGMEADANIQYERDVQEELSVTGSLVRESGLSRGV